MKNVKLPQVDEREAMEAGMIVFVWLNGMLVDQGKINKLEPGLVHIDGRIYKKGQVMLT